MRISICSLSRLNRRFAACSKQSIMSHAPLSAWSGALVRFSEAMAMAAARVQRASLHASAAPPARRNLGWRKFTCRLAHSTRGTNRQSVAPRAQEDDSRDEGEGKQGQGMNAQRDESKAKGEGSGMDSSSGGSQLKPGQGTAIVTGVVSLLLSFGYLLLASLLSNRELLPPPNEAFGQ